MATEADFDVTNEWQDLAATITNAASAATLFQCVSQDTVQVVAGGASAPSGKTGIVLRYLDSVELNNANIWVRNFDGDGATLSVTVL